MKKEMTKGQLRAALCYLVGWLTENSTQRVVSCTADITAGLPDDCKDSGADILKKMLSMGWAKRDGNNFHNFIWTSTCKTPKLKDDESVTKAVDELWDAMKSPKRKMVEPEEDTEAVSGIEKDTDSLPEPVPVTVTVTETENCTETEENAPEKCEDGFVSFSDVMNAIKGMGKDNPEVLVNVLRDLGWEVTCRKTIIQEL